MGRFQGRSRTTRPGRGTGRKTGSYKAGTAKKDKDSDVKFVPHTSNNANQYKPYDVVKKAIISKISLTFGVHMQDIKRALEPDIPEENDMDQHKPARKHASKP